MGRRNKGTEETKNGRKERNIWERCQERKEGSETATN